MQLALNAHLKEFNMPEPDVDTSTLIDTHDVEATNDDGYSIALYKAPDGRHWIHIIHSDMSSKYHGGLGFDQWVSDEDVGNWKNL